MNARTLVSLAQATAISLGSVGTALADGYYEDGADKGTGKPPIEVDDDSIRFRLDRSGPIVGSGCLAHAKGEVRVTTRGAVEVMDVRVSGLPANIELDVFLTQVPNPPFGMSWYQGDLETDDNGNGRVRYIGRFNEETFIVAPGTAPAPLVHDDEFPDAEENPATDPIHTFHVGVWFNSPSDAQAAGCPGIVTPFNGEHNAGVLLFNTSSFADEAGPLSFLK